MMNVSSVEQMRNMDKAAVEDYLVPEQLLMENAGLAACSVIHKYIQGIDKRYVIICGTGNNGGDGFVVARKIHSMGGEVSVFIAGTGEKLKGVSAQNLERLLKTPVSVLDLGHDPAKLALLEQELKQTDVIVDALFGTGLARDVEGFYREVIRLLNNAGKTVVSLDIPSGINGDTGQVMGIAVRADYTVTFGLPKYGNLLYPGYDYCGKLFVTHISFPPCLYNNEHHQIRINIPPDLEKRNPMGHKGSFGDVLFIAGASQYPGAPYFSAFSFLKAGGGYSRLAAPGSLVQFIATGGREIVFLPQAETASGSIAKENEDSLIKQASRVDMVVMGPGLSLDLETRQLVCSLSEKIDKPLLLDGDGITAVSENVDILKKRRYPTILTPHPGEMSRITGYSINKIREKSMEILAETSKKCNAIIVLKQAHSLIGFPDGKIFINVSGNCGMATAGSGDVLTGTIAAMYGLGLSIPDAVRAGVFVHGVAGDKAAEAIGQDGMTARDIMDFLPCAVTYYRKEYQVISRHYYNRIVPVL
ncbi:MAG: NAD(P)H-hydrate dehydratase [Spirochaetales bacterium]|nr:NAD(P)H-hydrate dehydratase [Spirochaetales bacterium]